MLRGPGYISAPTSMRLKGGMGALVQALRAHVPDANLVTGMAVRRLHASDAGIASEWSPQFPGYVAGAIEAAELGLASLQA